MSSDSPVSNDSGQRAGRSWRRLWIVLGALLVVIVGARAALPYAIPPLAGWLAMRQVGLDARIQNVDLEVFKGTLAVEGVWVGAPGRAPQDDAPPDPTAALFALDRIFADLAWTELVKGRVHLRGVTLDAPRIRLERLDDGHIDPMHGATPPPKDPADEAAAEPEPPALETPPETPPEGATADAAAPAGGGLRIVVDDLALRGAVLRVVEEADAEELLDFELAELDLVAFSMDGTSIGLGGIGLREPQIRAKREFLLDPTKSAGRPAASPEEVAPEDPASSGQPRGYRVDNLDVQRAEFQILVGDQVLDMALAVKADGVSLDTGSTFPLELNLQVGETGRLDVKGTAGAAPPSFVGKVTTDDLPLRLTLLAVREDITDWVKRLRLFSDVDVAFHSVAQDGSVPGLAASGRVAFAGLDVSDPQGDDLALSWDELEVLLQEVAVPMGDAAETTPMRVHVEKVALVAPKAVYRQPSDALDRLLRGRSATATAEESGADAEEAEPGTESAAAAPEESVEEKPGAPPAEIRIDQIEIQKGEARFHDEKVQPAFDLQVARLNATLAGVDPAAPSARKIDVDVLLGDGSSMKIDGHIGPGDGDLALAVQRLRLPPANPYARAAGVQLETGALTVTTHAKAKGRHWTVDNEVTLHDLRIDEPASQEFLEKLGMPIGLIISVLRDPKGDISLPVPLEFDEGEMQTGVAELVAGALRLALVGAATIPLKAVGGLFGDDGGFELEPIPSAPGVAEAVDGTTERGLAMASLLKERPELGIALTGRAGELDESFLKHAVLTDRVAEGGDLPDIEEGAGLIGRRQIKSALKKRAKGGDGKLSPEHEAHLERYVDATAVPDERYEELARARAVRIHDWLVEQQGVDPARVRVAEKTARGDPGIVLDLESYEALGGDA